MGYQSSVSASTAHFVQTHPQPLNALHSSGTECKFIDCGIIYLMTVHPPLSDLCESEEGEVTK